MNNEPVAWHYPGGKPDQCTTDKAYAEKDPAWTPMYYKQEWVGLTEPVAWGVFESNLHDMFFTQSEAQEMAKLKGTHAEVRPLYAAPPQRKPLSDEEIYSLADSLEIWNEDDEEWILDPNTFARAIEAAHGIKE